MKSINSIESIKLMSLNELGNAESCIFDMTLDCTSWNKQDIRNLSSSYVRPETTTQYQLLCRIESGSLVYEVETSQSIDKIQQFLLLIMKSMRSGLPLRIEASTSTEVKSEIYLHQIQTFDFKITLIK